MSQPVTPLPAPVVTAIRRLAEAASFTASAWILYGSRRNARQAVESDRSRANLRAEAWQVLAFPEQRRGMAGARVP